MAPFPLEVMFGKAGMFTVYLLIGFAFGWALEIAGFGDSRKLAAQFYFRDLTVLKVMFTAIVTAMVLIFAASGLGLLDYNRIWVNPTYLAPGIVGGLIMGVGFIIGGFCPGTSLVALATFKVDGLFFFLGVSTGVFIFGETVSQIAGFWNSTYMGRFTLPQWLGLEPGTVVLLAVLMALFMFWGGEKLERIFGKGDRWLPRSAFQVKRVGPAALVLTALLVLVMGQPSAMDRWERMAPEKAALLSERQVQIHPGELLGLMHDDLIHLVLLDVRDEADFNLFHLADARRVTADDLEGSLMLSLLNAPQATVVVLMSNGEERATRAWRILVAQNIVNVYILEGGVKHWLDLFGHQGHEQCVIEDAGDGKRRLRHVFKAALGSDQIGAEPVSEAGRDLEYTPKVKLEKKKVLGGGCG